MVRGCKPVRVMEWLVTGVASAVELPKPVVRPYWTCEVELERVVQVIVAAVSPGEATTFVMNGGGGGGDAVTL